MRNSKIKTALAALAIGAVTFTGCKKFLDVNDNPNSPVDVEIKYILPSVQGAIAAVTGGPMQVYGSFWSQYWTQSRGASQYKPIDQYQPGQADFDRTWGILYRDALQEIQLILAQKSNPQYQQYAGIAMLLKAYEFQLLTDAFGDIPLKEATAGLDDNLYPHYDKQEEVYDSIFSFIDQGMAMIDPASGYLPGDEDLVFGGMKNDKMKYWQQFGNTLKLRAYLRISAVNEDKARQGIARLYQRKEGFLSTDAKISYGTAGGNTNPLYAEIVGLSNVLNIVASETCVNAMRSLNDPRIFTFYAAVPDTNIKVVVGIPQGSYAAKPSNAKVSLPGAAVGAKTRDVTSATAPVIFISAAESYFLQAEAALKGYAGGDVKALYTQGITASFNSYKVDPGTYISDRAAAWPAGRDAQLEAIITQKYFAMCGNQGFEAWTEWRRTSFPKFFTPSQEGVLNGKYPLRFVYPNTEFTRNPNYPGTVEVGVPVWWNTKK